MAERPSNDPIRKAGREAKAQRRAGIGALCSDCGRADALVARSRPKRCEECYARARGIRATQGHHLGAEANSPVMVEIPTNSHRRLNESQYEWPPITLRNCEGSPLLAVAGMLRGSCDFVVELIVRLIEQCAELLEDLDSWLRERLGKWWEGTEFEGWQPQ